MIRNDTGLDEIKHFLWRHRRLIKYLQENQVFDKEGFFPSESVASPLHNAALLGRVSILRLFTVTYNFSIDARTILEGVSMTALHWAISYKNIDCVRLLLEQGANPNLGGNFGPYVFENSLALAKIHQPTKEMETILERAIKGKREVHNLFLPDIFTYLV